MFDINQPPPVDANGTIVDEALIQQMAALGISPDVLAMLGQNMHRGQALQDTPGAQGRTVGQTYVASSPIEHLSVAMRRMQGQKQDAAAQQEYARQLQANQHGIAAGSRAQSNLMQQLIDEMRRRQVQPTVGPVEAPQMMPDVPGAFP